MDKETADRFASVAIAPGVNIVRDPKKLYNHLEKAGKILFYANHSDSALKSFPDAVQSRFAGKNSPNKSRAHKRKKFTLKRTVHTILEFPDKEIYDAFKSALLDNGSVLDTNSQTRTVSYTKKDETVAIKILNSLKKNTVRLSRTFDRILFFRQNFLPYFFVGKRFYLPCAQIA